MESMEAIYARFGRELRRVRKQRGLTQADLARRVNLGRTSVANIESGQQRVHLHTLMDFATALEVSPAELLPEETVEVDEIAARLGSLPARERDWIMRVVSPSESRSKEERSHGTSS
jgi:transcriptional regulator with XRE-family HTH domain